MERTLARNWWALTVRGAFAVLFGLLAFAWGDSTGRFLSSVLGVFLLVEGGLSAVSSLGAHSADERPTFSLVEGAVGIVLGVILLAGVHESWVALRVVAGWVAAVGLLEGAASSRFSGHLATPRLLIASAAIALLFAAVVLWTSTTPLVAMWFVAGWAMFDGAIALGVAFTLRRDVGADHVHLFGPTLR